MRILVDDFVMDRHNAAEGIRNAFACARATGNMEIHFSYGIYELRDAVQIHSTSIAHDDGCGDISEKLCHLVLDGGENIHITGETDNQGNPATVLLGCHNNPIQERLPSILWVTGCKGFQISDITFSRKPETAWTGIISSIDKDWITVLVTSSMTVPEETGAYCMNRFEYKARKLVGESLTFGFDYENRFHRCGEQKLCLKDKILAGVLSIGDGLSWHQSGLTDFLLFFANCKELCIQNVRVTNTNAFALLTENCEGIQAHRLFMKPADEQFFTGPRDGWKIYRCSGKILVEQCHFEGFRMDAQNIHSNYFVLEQILDDRHFEFSCKYAPIPLRNGTELRIHTAGATETFSIIRTWRFLPGKLEESCQSGDASAGRIVKGKKNYITRYDVELEEPLNESVMKEFLPGSLAEPLCWEPEEYVCRNSVFRNIAGAGNLVRCRNVLIERNTYENLMNAGVLIGAEFDTHCESGHGKDIVIRDNVFRNIGFKPRYNQYGCAAIAVKSQGFHGAFNENILIENNVFEDCKCAIELNDAKNVRIKGNKYHRVENSLSVDHCTVDHYSIECEEAFQ